MELLGISQQLKWIFLKCGYGVLEDGLNSDGNQNGLKYNGDCKGDTGEMSGYKVYLKCSTKVSDYVRRRATGKVCLSTLYMYAYGASVEEYAEMPRDRSVENT